MLDIALSLACLHRMSIRIHYCKAINDMITMQQAGIRGYNKLAFIIDLVTTTIISTHYTHTYIHRVYNKDNKYINILYITRAKKCFILQDH